MMTLDALIITTEGLDRADVERWIDQDWVRPAGSRGTWLFREIDVARLRLIRDLRHELGLQDDALPIVLRLLDQLYDERRRLRRVRDALDRTVPQEFHEALLQALAVRAED
jgi:chaperone modulatory protein CbpM